MKITLGAATLVDDTASPRIRGVIEQIGGQSVVQNDLLYGAANQAKFPRGNVGGKCVFTAWCSYASYAAVLTAFSAAYARLDTQATLQITYGTGNTMTMLNAICSNVERVAWDGVGLKLRYSFEITTLTSP